MKNLYHIKLAIIIIIVFSMYTNSFSQLSGTYTIGSGGNYTTITSAVNDLVTNGVKGPVIFNILAGIYHEQVSIGNIPGTSSINTVTFRSSTGDTSDVSWYGTSNSPNYILSLGGAKHVTFSKLKFINKFDTLYIPDMVIITSPSGNIRFLDNLFVQHPRANSELIPFSIIRGSGNITDVEITGNRFSSQITYMDYYGIYLDGLNTAVKISNNIFERIRFSIILSGGHSHLIENNSITNSAGTIFLPSKGISLSSVNSFILSKNKIILGGHPLSSGSICFEALNCGGDENSIIVNNFVNSLGYTQGIQITNSNNVKIYFNSTYSHVRSSSNIVLSSCNNIDMRNNLFVNLGSPFYYYTYISSGTTVSSDYNNFFNNVVYFARFNGTQVFPPSEVNKTAPLLVSNEFPIPPTTKPESLLKK